jgi:DNA-binding MarR family transcriptional regulator
MKSYFTFDLKGLSLRLDSLADGYLAAKYHMTYSEFLILLSLAYCKTLTQREIAHWSQLSEMMVSKIVRKLEQRKQVLRNKDPNDLKVNLVTISPKSAKIAWKAMDELEALFVRQLSPAQIEILPKLHNEITKMRDTINPVLSGTRPTKT